MRRLSGRFCKTAKAALPLGAAVLLAGCSSSDETELRGWMNAVKQATRVTSQPVPRHGEFIPFAYNSRGALEPFYPQKILPRLREGALQPYRLPYERQREVLEGIPLDQVRMVGVMRQGGTNVALIEINRSTHMVRVGNHLGQNFGVVTRITETELFLNEIVQDAAGEWVERPAKLKLQS